MVQMAVLHIVIVPKILVMFGILKRSVDIGAAARKHSLFFVEFFFYSREMAPQRLARVSEINEEGSECESVENAAPELLQKNKTPPRRNSNQLHVTINAKPEEIDCDGNSSQHSNGTNGSRRPSVLIQEILSTRRPSAIMAAIRSPKQFVNRYRREYVYC